MAHQVTISRLGRAEMMYVGAAPWWHGGQELPSHATSREAMEAASLTWRVDREILYVKQGDAFVPITEAVANVRSDTREVLGVVSPDYSIIQNLQAFQLMDEIVGESAAMYETAGSLNGGRRVWALAKLPKTLHVHDDVVDQYLLFVTGHDGKQRFLIRFTPVRVVCANTLAVALGSQTLREVSIVHAANADVRLDAIRKTLGIGHTYFEVFGEQMERLTSKMITSRMFEGFLERVAPIPSGANVQTDAIVRAKSVQETIAYLFREGRGNNLRTAADTAWGAFNAVTEYIDHVTVLTTKGEVKNSALNTTLFGSGDALRQRAWDAALALLK
jgi:phage/plasmid-like protein (TIGR03299 family)